MTADVDSSTASWQHRQLANASARPDAVPLDWPNRACSFEVSAAGISWHVQRSGQGPTLVLIHGTASATHSWRDLLQQLTPHFHVIAMDLPGHGFSSRRSDDSMALPDLADSVAALLRSIDAKPSILVGHSAGAAIALRMTLDQQVSPQSIIGLNAALLPFGGALRVFFAPLAQWFAQTQLMPRMIARRASDIAAVRRVLAGTGSVIDDVGVELYQRLLQKESHVASVLAMMASWDLSALLEDIPKLQCDLYLVTGLNDQAVSPKETDAIVRALPSTQVIRLTDCGHLAHEERPIQVAKLIAELAGNGEQRV